MGERPPIFFLFLIALCGRLTSGAAPGEDLQAFGECISQLRQTSQWYHRLLPPPIFEMERRLVHMDRGISFLEDDLRVVTKQVKGSWAHPDRALVFNAAEGCRSFLAAYRSQARLFTSLMAACLLMLVTLTARAAFTILPAPEKKTAQRAHEAIPEENSPENPADRAAGSGRRG